MCQLSRLLQPEEALAEVQVGWGAAVGGQRKSMGREMGGRYEESQAPLVHGSHVFEHRY